MLILTKSLLLGYEEVIDDTLVHRLLVLIMGSTFFKQSLIVIQCPCSLCCNLNQIFWHTDTDKYHLFANVQIYFCNCYYKIQLQILSETHSQFIVLMILLRLNPYSNHVYQLFYQVINLWKIETETEKYSQMYLQIIFLL